MNMANKQEFTDVCFHCCGNGKFLLFTVLKSFNGTVDCRSADQMK